MILLSIEAKDEISEVDPLVLEIDYGEGACWLEVVRLGVRMITRFSAHWRDGRWWKREVEQIGDVYVARDRPSTSAELADAIFDQLSKREELRGRVDREAIREALDEGRFAPSAIALEVLSS